MSWKRRIDHVSCTLGRSILAGLAGTSAISLSQLAEMRLTRRGPASTPAQAVEKVLGIQAVNQQHQTRLTHVVHWGYGTSWGLFRGLLDTVGLRGFKASLIQWATVSGVAMTMLPRLEVAPPVHKWPAKAHLSEGIHHLVYAAAVGYAYDLLNKEHHCCPHHKKCCDTGWFSRRRGRSKWFAKR